MLLQFKGFDEQTPWKTGTDAYVHGYGAVPAGDTRDYDADTAAFLLATHLFVPPDGTILDPPPPPAPDPLPLSDPLDPSTDAPAVSITYEPPFDQTPKE